VNSCKLPRENSKEYEHGLFGQLVKIGGNSVESLNYGLASLLCIFTTDGEQPHTSNSILIFQDLINFGLFPYNLVYYTHLL